MSPIEEAREWCFLQVYEEAWSPVLSSNRLESEIALKVKELYLLPVQLRRDARIDGAEFRRVLFAAVGWGLLLLVLRLMCGFENEREIREIVVYRCRVKIAVEERIGRVFLVVLVA
jgi:hypothetical protein